MKNIEDQFISLERVLKGEEKKNLEKIKKYVSESIEYWKDDQKLEEEWDDQRYKEIQLMIDDLVKYNEEIEKIREENIANILNVEGGDRLLEIVDRNKGRIEILKDEAEEIKRENEKIKRSYAGKLGAEKRYHKAKLRGTVRSYAGKLGQARRCYSESIETIGEIYIISNSKIFRNIDNFKKRVMELCEEEIWICEDCDYPESHCKCEE